MTQTINLGNGMQCRCSSPVSDSRIVYILYPADTLATWIEGASRRLGVTIAIVTGMDWQNVFSPWPAPGVPKGTEPFKGESPQFLEQLRTKILPCVEKALGIESDATERTLVGVSMSGLFALWQWMVCDLFTNIASLSGSFWYEGFMDWMQSRPIPQKTGKAFFLLGDKESHSRVKAFNAVGPNTQAILTLLQNAGIHTTFRSVPGDHYANPLPRLALAINTLFPSPA